MRRAFVPVVAGCAWLLASPAAAAPVLDYTPTIMPSTFVPLDLAEPGVTAHTITGNAVKNVETPFGIPFYGDVFNWLNISAHGYVSFSSLPGSDNASGRPADPAVNANQYPLPSSTTPNGIVAAWWDDLNCPAGTIKTRDAEIQGSRTFTIEWNGCHLSGSESNTLQMQLRFTEGSSNIRVYYGVIGGPGSNWSATPGLENPPRWRSDESGGWTLESTGGNLGVTPALGGTCVAKGAAPGCDASAWPTNQVIQYGPHDAADLKAGIDPTTGRTGIELLSFTGRGPTAVQFENVIENGGKAAAVGVTWNYYLSKGAALDPASDTLLGCSHTTPESFAGREIRTFTATCTITPPSGTYRICARLDPPSGSLPNGAVIEGDEGNNDYCSDPFAVGIDLVGWVNVPKSGVAGQTMKVPVVIENRGIDPASAFRAQIWLQDCAASGSTGSLLAWEETVSLQGTFPNGIWAEEVDVPARSDVRGESICAVLVIDPDNAIAEVDDSNNRYSTCVANGSVPPACTVLDRPNFRISLPTASLPDGCFFGEPIELAVQICNEGLTEARGFGLAFYVDDNTTTNIYDTRILSVPQACAASSECVDLGGGAPDCIRELCQAPCLTDADCGANGLQCEPSVSTGSKTCQLVLPARACQDVSIHASIPTINVHFNAPFTDGTTYFSAIVDWTGAVIELEEGAGNMSSTKGTSCWSRNPDFAAVELRTLPTLASGEAVPVFRRVRNFGVEPGVYTYRYLLSPNNAISEIDVALEIEGIGPVGSSVVGARTDDTGHDLVRLPDGLVAGTYYLGIVLDPADQVLELLEDNNVARSDQFQVIDSSLRVVSTSLRTATVGATYAVQLQAAGGAGGYTWSITRGELPRGLKLETNGLLGGTANKEGIYLFEATVASGSNIASASFVVEVAPAHGPLAITLAELPPAVLGVEYSVLLGASGGRPPYQWECPTRPDWLVLRNGYLVGTGITVADPVAVVCSVTDANGTRVSKNYNLAVYPSGGIRIRSTELPIADVGVEMIETCLLADGGSGTYDWSIAATSSLPPGVGFEGGENGGCFSGVPGSCGTFLADVTVADAASGRTDTRRLTLTVSCSPLRLTTRSLPDAERGVEYPVTQLATTSSSPLVFRIASGELPLGLTLSADGKISGLVAVDAPSGVYHAAVRFHDGSGGDGVDAIAIQVPADPVPPMGVLKTTSGCTASGGGSAALLPFAAVLAVLGLRRRRSIRPVAAGLAVAALLLPAMAYAQSTPAYATHHRPVPYEKLASADSLELPAKDATISITPPWPVRFFGEEYSSFLAHENGLLLFSGHNEATTPRPIPFIGTGTPRNFIAGWWDDHELFGRPDTFRYAERGTAPNRELVFEWNWLTAIADDPLDGGEHQISLFENGDIAIRWGNIVDSAKVADSHRAVIGLMDALGSMRSVPFLDCSDYAKKSSAACGSIEWNESLKNQEAVFTTRPNLRILETTTAFEGRAGLVQTFTAIVYNHGVKSTQAPVRFFVSTDTRLSDDDVPVGTSDPITIGSFAEARASLTAPLPRGLAEGRYHLLAVADPDASVDEFLEDDNLGASEQFRVPSPLPDLAVIAFGAPSFGVPGSSIAFDLTIRNAGNLDATLVPFAVVLSDNEVITASDFPIFQGTVSVGWLEEVELPLVVALPANTRPGSYRVGVILDPEGLVPEIDKLDNTAIADRTFLVTVDGLVITTVAPRSIQVGSEFCIPLQAEGGDGVYAWDLVEGSLPPGLELIAGTLGASICGRPTAVGSYAFTLEVASGDLEARTQLILEVSRTTLEFSIGARELRIARFQVPYEAGLLAFGGTTPYTWELDGGALPAGLSFHRDGLVFGTPLEAGTFVLDVRVTDAANRTDTESVTLLVMPPSRLTCSSRTLGPLVLGEEYAGRLFAAGGNANYEWTTGSTSRPDDPNALDLVAGDPPPGLVLDAGTGEVTGTPGQVGSYLWNVDVRSGTETDTCILAVDVVGGQDLTIVTTGLPTAVPDKEYRAPLKAIGGEGTLRWTLAYGSYLPDGLTLDSSGAIHGVPTHDDLQDRASRTFGFRVEVRDARNLKGTGTLSVTLALATEAEKKVIERDEGGCRTAGGGSGLAALALVLVALWRRR